MVGRFPGRGPFSFPPRPHMGSTVILAERNNALLDTPSLLLQSVILLGDRTLEGQLVEAVAMPWFDIIDFLNRDPSFAYQLRRANAPSTAA